MRFLYGKQDMRTLERAQEASFLLTNGLGGYASVTAAYSVPRCDQGILVAAVKAPNERITLVHRLRETLNVGGREVYLSSQSFADETEQEDGYRNLASFAYEYLPVWTYQVRGVRVRRTMALAQEANTAALVYTVENRSGLPCTLAVDPFLKFCPKEAVLEEKKEWIHTPGQITSGAYTMYLKTDLQEQTLPECWQELAYPEDEKDGRPAKGLTGCCCRFLGEILPGETAEFELVFSLDRELPGAREIISAQLRRLQALENSVPFTDPLARQLVLAADAYIARRDSTNGKTILAGYPLFSDWGRDTMIALPGCCLAVGRFDDAKSILRTFLAYEKDGLVPNLFPEGEAKPMYNTVDAALLLIDCVWQYVQRTGDLAFAEEAWPVMERIAAFYQKGTRHSIGMDTDGLIFAGGGLDQVTWMDVCVQGILPTPRHGKPVEINAYWYNALRILDELGRRLGKPVRGYAELAERVKASFVEKFYIPEKGYLRDVISDTKADEQLRCNQIWAVSMPFTMLSAEQEREVVAAVERHLYTPCGLRTLSPEDPEYHPTYGGEQLKRDMAYHQGTTWVFPMGAYYLAWLKVHGSTPDAARQVRERMEALEPMLREGCAGQLPEIYDGDHPTDGKGCFGQAWSVGEMLRVMEALHKITHIG